MQPHWTGTDVRPTTRRGPGGEGWVLRPGRGCRVEAIWRAAPLSNSAAEPHAHAHSGLGLAGHPRTPGDGQLPGRPLPAAMALPRGPMPLGEYDMVAKLGAGSFAQVFRAVHRTKGTVRAVKAIQLERLSPKLLKGLEAEITILREVRHPNISEPTQRAPTPRCLRPRRPPRARLPSWPRAGQCIARVAVSSPGTASQSSLWTFGGQLAGCT